MADQKDKDNPKSGKKRLMPIPSKRQSLQKALEKINKQYGETLAKLAKEDTSDGGGGSVGDSKPHN